MKNLLSSHWKKISSNQLFCYFFRKEAPLLSRIFLLVSEFSVIFTITVWKNEKFYLTHWKISSNQLFSNFFICSKTIAFTKFLRKKCEREFLQFLQRLHFLNFLQKLREINTFSTKLHCMLISRKFCLGKILFCNSTLWETIIFFQTKYFVKSSYCKSWFHEILSTSIYDLVLCL